MAQLKEQEKQLSEEEESLEPHMQQMLLHMSQSAHSDAPVGPDESGHVEVKRWGDVPEFDYEPKDHIELGNNIVIMDVERCLCEKRSAETQVHTRRHAGI